MKTEIVISSTEAVKAACENCDEFYQERDGASKADQQFVKSRARTPRTSQSWAYCVSYHLPGPTRRMSGNLIIGKGSHLERGEFGVSELTVHSIDEGEVINPEYIKPIYLGFAGILADNWFAAGIMRFLSKNNAITLLTMNEQDYYDSDNQ